jgi:hypothetical protein
MTRARPAPWACGTWGTWGKLGGRDATEHDGKLNVVLRNLQRLLAVYRVRNGRPVSKPKH